MNKSITRVNLTEMESKQRDMGNIELIGAVACLYDLLTKFNKQEYGESYVTLDEVDGDTYYSGQSLFINDNGYVLRDDEGKLIYLSEIFMLEGNDTDLFGKACNYDGFDEEDDDNNEYFTVRI